MQPKLLLPLAAVALIFATPAVAGAAITTQLAPGTLTINGDPAANDNIIIAVNAQGQLTNNFGVANGFADAADFDANTAGSQPIVSGTVGVVANLGGGNDAINLSAADLNNSTLSGEAGDDIIVGSDNADVINGGDGNDRLTGFRGGDTVSGQAGNDTMIWNNGDGSDVNNGGDGNDETLVTLSAVTDGMTLKTAPNGFRFDRVTAVTFGIDITEVERFAATAFGGDDTFTADPDVTLPMTIDAGSGDDAITTGAGADVVNGADGNDTLNGAGGGDRLIGDRGADTMNGGEGDDVLVWNNGDGSDVMNGDGGVDRIEDNLGAGPDVSTLKPENGRVRYDRTSTGAFSLSIAGAEQFELNSLGGDDTLTTSPGVGITVFADGGAGNDTFNVREGDPGFFVGSSGTDSATVDATDATGGDIETVDRPAGPAQPQPQPAPLAPGAGTIGKQAKVKGGKAAIKVSCPAGTSGCTGYVTLLLGNREIGRAAYSIADGTSNTLLIKVAKKPTKRKPLTVKARTSSRAAADKETKLKLVL